MMLSVEDNKFGILAGMIDKSRRAGRRVAELQLARF
jgi:hypothetical protein